MVSNLLRSSVFLIVALSVSWRGPDIAVEPVIQRDREECTEIEPFLKSLSSDIKSERESAKKALLRFSDGSARSRQCLIARMLRTAAVSDKAELVKSQERFREWSEAINILGTIRTTEALDTLIDCLECNDGRFGLSLGRFPAALAVVNFGEIALPKLSGALRHKNPMTRNKAAEVLYAMGGDRAKQVIKKAVPKERVSWIADSMKNMLRTWNAQRRDEIK